MSQTWNQLEARVEARKDEEWRVDADAFYRRWYSQTLSLVVGATVFDKETRAVGGFSYLLPMLIESQVLIDHKGKFRVDLHKTFQWTSSFLSEVEGIWRQDHETELLATLMYAPSWTWRAGLVATAHSLGAGLKVQF